MSELRFNPISREWVIIATDRAKRPEDFVKKREIVAMPDYKPNCPFCAGNEDKTPGETYRIGDEKNWNVRSVYNLFGALSLKDNTVRSGTMLHHSINGFGSHEVIIEHQKHNSIIALMNNDEVKNIIEVYRQRYLSVQKMEGIESIIIFKNYGPTAGTSLEHPHSQLIATPIVPPQIRRKMEHATAYFDNSGKCIFCDMLKEELSSKDRLVFESDSFVSFLPFAGAAPFITWIFPRRHMPSFGDINNEEVYDLAINLKTTLSKLYNGLENPDFNYTISSVPVKECGTDYYHWYITIVPRLNQPAGFELGSGIFISTSLPEESAKFLRNVR